MQILDYVSYKSYVLDWIKEQPKAGHGIFKKMAESIRSSSVVMTQVFRGDRELTPEQALGIAHFIGLSESETEFFLLLVHKARAGSHELSALIDKQLDKIKAQSKQIRSKINYENFSEEAKAQFYSSWAYSALRLGLAIPKNTPQKVAAALTIDKSYSADILEFLIKHGLLVESPKNEFQLGPTATHVSHDNPLVERHHVNWRLKALESLRFKKIEAASDLHYTGPMVISKELSMLIREELMKLLENSHNKIKQAPNEQLHCLNIDWFRLL